MTRFESDRGTTSDERPSSRMRPSRQTLESLFDPSEGMGPAASPPPEEKPSRKVTSLFPWGNESVCGCLLPGGYRLSSVDPWLFGMPPSLARLVVLVCAMQGCRIGFPARDDRLATCVGMVFEKPGDIAPLANLATDANQKSGRGHDSV